MKARTISCGIACGPVDVRAPPGHTERHANCKHAMMSAPYWLDPALPPTSFPDPALALIEPNGLLAIGGDLSQARLLAAYRQGIFPWFNRGEPILWWSPDPRMVLYPERLRISRSLCKTLRQGVFEVTLDRDFAAVINACAAPRDVDGGTWISAEMAAAYIALHHAGHAHSVEVWRDGQLAGGLYGISIGRMFFGESMFSRQRDASKVGLVRLTQQLATWGFPALDCQVYTTHLESLGAVEIPRREFNHLLAQACNLPPPSAWRFDDCIAQVHTDTG